MVPYLISVTCHHCDAGFKLLSASMAGYHSDGGLDGTKTLLLFMKKKYYLLFLCWLLERYTSSSVESLLENQVVHC